MLRRAPVCLLLSMPREWPSIKKTKKSTEFTVAYDKQRSEIIDFSEKQNKLRGNRRETDLHAVQGSVSFAEGDQGGGEAFFALGEAGRR